MSERRKTGVSFFCFESGLDAESRLTTEYYNTKCIFYSENSQKL